MHYVIFIPNATGYSAQDQLAAVGLDTLCDTFVGPTSENAELGGVAGRLIRWDDHTRQGRNATPGVSDKTWWWDYQRRYAIGHVAEAPPTPDDLKRNDRYNDSPYLTSFPCTLKDEQVWLVPIARQLPSQWIQCPETGRPVIATVPRFAWYFDQMLAAVQAIGSGEATPENTPADYFELAVKALTLNYRICPEIVYALGLFGAEHAASVIGAACELSIEFNATTHWTVRADNPILAQKKTEQLPSVSAT